MSVKEQPYREAEKRLWDYLGVPPAPTLFIRGENDTFTSPKDAEYAAPQFPDARLVLLPKSGHLPEVVARATDEFLRSNSAAAATA